MANRRITDQPTDDSFVRFADGFAPRFLVTVDTEEEFDWLKPIRATGHSLDSVPQLATFQAFCERQGVCPVYLVDYPIATSPLAAEILREPVMAGRAEIGVQLHAWVSPPHDEEVTAHNSFAGNLPPELEAAKFRLLRDTIEQAFGRAPRIYRAGRYGVGPHTAALLREQSIAIDTSVRARFDYSASGGVNFRDMPVRPWWIDQGLIELPLTTVYWGGLKRIGHWLYPLLWRAPWLRGILARIGLLERIPLTPEGVSRIEVLRGIAMAVQENLPVLVFSFHSPSLQAGHTPYVRTEADVAEFYGWWETVFADLQARGIRPTCVAELLRATALA